MEAMAVETLSICSLYASKDKLGCCLFEDNAISFKEYNIADTHDLTFHLNINKVDTIFVNDLLAHTLNKNQLTGKVVPLHSRYYLEENIFKSLLSLKTSDSFAAINNKLRNVLDPNEEEIMKALSSLLMCLQENNLGREIKVENIKRRAEGLTLNKATYEYLELIKEETHPCLVGGKGRSKEGFTVFNLYNSFTTTPQGSKRLLHLFLNPLCDKETLQEKYNTIEYIHQHLMVKERIIIKLMRKIANLKIIFKRFDEFKTDLQDWSRLRTSFQAMMRLRDEFQSTSEQPLLIQQLSSSAKYDKISYLLSIIDKVLHFEPFLIKSNINQQLDTCREEYSRLNIELSRLTLEYPSIQSHNGKIVFIPQIGYLINTLNEVYDQNWVYQFCTENGNFYTNEVTQQLDEKRGDKYAQIQDIEKEIVIELEDLVRQHSHNALDIYLSLGEFDCALAVSKVSKNLVRPVLGDSNLIVRNGWHLLMGDKSVSNNNFSYSFSQEQKLRMYNSELNLVNSNYANKCVLVSGANASGKTLYAKQMAIILFLAHIGSFVPAEQATIPLTDNIASFNPRSSLFLQQYGVESELRELNRILTHLTRRSLVIIDEFGHSSSYFETERIIFSLLQYLTTHDFPESSGGRSPGAPGLPLSIVITHMKDLFNKDLQYSANLRHIQTLINASNDDIQYLYKLSPGIYRGHHAVEVCRKMGLDKRFVDRALEVTEELQGLTRQKIKPRSRITEIEQRIKETIRGIVEHL